MIDRLSLRSPFLLLALAAPLVAGARGVPYRFDYRAYGPVLPVLTWNTGAQTYVEMPHGIPVTGAFVGDRAARRFVPVRRSGRFYVIPAVARRTLLVTPGFNVALSYRGPIPHPLEQDNQQKLDSDLTRLQSATGTLSVLLARRPTPPASIASAAHMRRMGWTRFPNHPVPGGSGTLMLFANAYLPSGWSLRYDAPVSPLTPVDWSAARNWQAALGDLAIEHGWRLTCRHERCTIEPSWTVRAGSTLRETLRGWAHTAGWTLIWKPRWDRRMAGAAVYYGPFRSAAARYVRDLTRERVPLRAVFWRGNRTIEILPTGRLSARSRTHG